MTDCEHCCVCIIELMCEGDRGKSFDSSLISSFLLSLPAFMRELIILYARIYDVLNPSFFNRTGSNNSVYSSAKSSLAMTGSTIQSSLRPLAPAGVSNIPELPPGPTENNSSDGGPKVQMTQLKLDFKVDRVKLGITQETVQVRDQGLFDFEIRSITTGAVIKDHENEFNFKIEDMTARYAQQDSVINYIFFTYSDAIEALRSRALP